jgi:D-glycero-alpha-D-manno-heptose-7-phosphate kinase
MERTGTLSACVARALRDAFGMDRGVKFISKTPLRVSLFGGGTDYPEYLEHHPGCVLGTTIDKYVYIIALPMSSVAPWKFRLSYRRTEEVDRVEEIQHPVVRAVLSELGWHEPLNIATMADLPGGTGLGSSSAFTVGFLNLVNRLRNVKVSRLHLAREAIRIEREVLRENVGVQDQIHAAFGGLNLYRLGNGSFSVAPVRVSRDTADLINRHLMLVFTGMSRHASGVVREQLDAMREKRVIRRLDDLVRLTERGAAVLESAGGDVIGEIGRMLDEAWRIKRSLSPGVSTPQIDAMYAKGRQLGALGGKLCGAGGGGFLLFLAPPETHAALAGAFGAANLIKIEATDRGSEVHSFD